MALGTCIDIYTRDSSIMSYKKYHCVDGLIVAMVIQWFWNGRDSDVC